MVVDDRLYDLIYENAWKTPGYDEYHVFSNEVLRVDDPLSYLESVSSVYWAVGHYLEEKGTKNNIRILDFGCGMGYLTYAIARRGYNVIGLDISPVAVKKAKERYGDNYLCMDILNKSTYKIGSFDVILCIEMIEHVIDPVALIKNLRYLLGAGGQIILTTPSKSSFPNDAIWETDNPPVHLWWFTQKAIEEIAFSAGYSKIEFIDIRQAPTGRIEISNTRDYSKPICQHIFNKKGNFCFKGHREYVFRIIMRRIALRVGIYEMVNNVRNLLFGNKRSNSNNLGGPANICAVLSK
jgi:SAM-dependent methyltransferase